MEAISTTGRFLYVSMERRVVPNCIYEIHLSRRGSTEDFGTEHIFLDRDNYQVLAFAVEVTRPILDIKALLKVWAARAKECAEHPSNEKIVYLID